MDAENAGSSKKYYVADVSDVKTSRSNSRLIRVLVVVALVAVCAVIGLVIAYVMKAKEDSPEAVPAVCDTGDCAKAASRVLASMDTSVDPCDNFYQYACGQWKKANIIPEDKSSQSVLALLVDKVTVTNKYLLEDPVFDKDEPAIQKSKDMYTSCVNLAQIETLNTSVVIPVLTDLGGWPVLGASTGGSWNETRFDVVEFLTKLRRYATKPLIDLFVSSDLKQTEQRVIYLNQPTFGLPGRSYYTDEGLQRMRDAYVTFAKSFAELLGADRTVAEEDIQKMLQMETEIANISMPAEDRRDSEKLYHKMDLTQLAINFTEPNASEPFQLSWESYVTAVMRQANVTINGSERVVVYAVPYFQKMISVLRKYDKRTIANYGIWLLLKSHAPNLPRRFRELKQDYDAVVFGQVNSPPRWQYCVYYTTRVFGMAVGHMFVQETFDKSAKSAALEMIRYLRSAFLELLEEVEWMDEATKLLAKEKEETIKAYIGYPDEVLDHDKLNKLYENNTVDKEAFFHNVIRSDAWLSFNKLNNLREPYNKSEWTLPPSTVNAYYRPVTNSIMFPAGILQPPLYSKGQPRSMNYGGIGMVIGHEITHGFDDRGRQFDKEGNLVQWWDATIIQKFKDKAQCIVDQYGGYNQTDANMTLNGINTQGENIADNGGVKQAFRAYRRWVERQGHEEASLPGVDFTHNQLFFINFAQIWCNNIKPAAAVRAITTGVHSPMEFRVIGTMRNLPEFSAAFNCPSTKYMNPQQKCSVW